MELKESEEVRQIKRMIDDFMEQEIKPLEEQYRHFLGEDAEMNIIEGTGSDYRMCDEYLDLWRDIRKRSVEAGIYTMHMPEDVGGGGVDLLPFSMILEHLENRNPNGFHSLVWDTGSVTMMLRPAYDDEYQREKYFEPVMAGEKLVSFALTEPNQGSDATRMESSGERDGDEWVLNGQKAFISKGPVCDFYMLNVRTSGSPGDTSGITTFLVDRDEPGVSIDKVQRPMGGQPGRHAIINFNDVRVSDDRILGTVDEGFKQLIGWIATGRISLAASAVGRAQWMLDQCVEYSQQREAFDSHLSDYQGIQFPLADLATDIEQARLLYRYTAWKVDEGDRAVKEQSMAKLRGAAVWNDAADLAVQIHGGSGWMRSLPYEGEYRSARRIRISEGTDEIQRRTIARELFRGN